jgi:hypothetical protein
MEPAPHLVPPPCGPCPLRPFRPTHLDRATGPVVGRYARDTAEPQTATTVSPLATANCHLRTVFDHQSDLGPLPAYRSG